jgi:large subunit ribosomal protein L47
MFIRNLFKGLGMTERPAVNMPSPTPDPSPPKPVPPPEPTPPTPSPTTPAPSILFSLGELKHFTGYGQLPPSKPTADDTEWSPNGEFHVPTGRSWKIDELRLKSNEDLNKLWYVLLREKNRILGDSRIAERFTGRELDKTNLEKVHKSMNRLSHVIKERETLCLKYRRRLEDNYCRNLRDKLQEGYAAFTEEQKINPPISYTLLRAKFSALRGGVDNLAYISKEVEAKEKKQQLKDYLRAKYAYGKKKIVDVEKASPETLQSLNKDDHILTFRNHIERQLAENVSSVSQEEILRAHVKNWKILNLKQRRVVLHFLNQRRAKDAKDIFVQELNLLAQKIAYEEKNVQESTPKQARAT